MSDQTKPRVPRAFSHYVLKSLEGWYRCALGSLVAWDRSRDKARKYTPEEVELALRGTRSAELTGAYFVPVLRPATAIPPCISVARSRELVACAELLLDEGASGLPKLRNVLADLKKELA